MTTKHKIPNVGQQISYQSGMTTQSWYRYLSGVEELSTRLDGVSDTTGSETLGQLITKVQAILDAFKTD